MNFSQFLRGSSMNENRGSWPQPLILARTPSSVVFWFLNSRKRVIWLESHFWHHVGKEKTLRKQTPLLFNTPHAGPIHNKLRTYYIICSQRWTESGARAEKNSEFPGTNYVPVQIYKRFVRSNGNIVLIIPKTFFEVRPINHLKTIYWTHRHFNLP